MTKRKQTRLGDLRVMDVLGWREEPAACCINGGNAKESTYIPLLLFKHACVLKVVVTCVQECVMWCSQCVSAVGGLRGVLHLCDEF